MHKLTHIGGTITLTVRALGDCVATMGDGCALNLISDSGPTIIYEQQQQADGETVNLKWDNLHYEIHNLPNVTEQKYCI